jgi:hypothetical protein
MRGSNSCTPSVRLRASYVQLALSRRSRVRRRWKQHTFTHSGCHPWAPAHILGYLPWSPSAGQIGGSRPAERLHARCLPLSASFGVIGVVPQRSSSGSRLSAASQRPWCFRSASTGLGPARQNAHSVALHPPAYQRVIAQWAAAGVCACGL